MPRWLKYSLLLLSFPFIFLILTFGNTWNITLLIAAIALYFWLTNKKILAPLAFMGSSNKGALINTSKPKITFEDVAGQAEIIEDVKDVVDFLKNPEKYSNLGARLPKGVLFIGPSGVGKTLLAKAIAGEAGIPFHEISGSAFIEMYVGVGAKRVRDLFKNRGIIFIDEIDAIGKRSDGDTGGQQEHNQTINQLLTEMDGFKSNAGVIVFGATNLIRNVDPALLRPGRFDRKLFFSYPDANGRLAILKVHTKNKALAQDVDLEKLARRISGFSGADLENLTNEAAILAGKNNKKEIDNNDFERAKERVVAGLERKRIMTDKEKRVLAYHETGHALMALLLGETTPNKISVIARGMSLGITFTETNEEQTNPSKSSLLNQIKMLLGGRSAEIIALDTETVGAQNDLERATELALAMVCEFGMSSELGLINFTKLASNRELGPSEEIKIQKDKAVQAIIGNAFEETKELLRTNRKALDAISKKLFEKENLEKEEIEEIYLAMKDAS